MDIYKLYEHSARLLEIAKEYKDHLIMAASMDDQMGLVDEISAIEKDVEG